MIKAEIYDPDKELTVHLYRAESEDNRDVPEDLLEALRKLGIESRPARENPETIYSAWSIFVDLVKHHGQLAGIVALIGLWLKERNKRRIELRKGDLKVSAASPKELAAALASMERLIIAVTPAKLKKPKKP